MPLWNVPAVLLLGAATLVAQRPVLTVGGSNPNYPDLPAAVAAAAPGAVVVVRPGFYTGFSTNKPLRILLEFDHQTGAITPPPGAAYSVTVHDLPAGSQFVMQGRNARVQAGWLGAIRVVDCQGLVTLSALNVTAGAGVALDVRNAATVVAERSYLGGAPGLQVQDAVVATTAVHAASNFLSAVVGLRCRLEFSQGSLTGYRMPAMRVQDAVVRLAGDGATAIAVGGGPTGPVAAIEAIDSELRWNPARFVVTPANGAPALLRVRGQELAVDVPGINASGGPLGAPMTARLHRSGSALGVLVLGSLAPPRPMAGVDGVFLDPNGPLQVLAIGNVTPGGLSVAVTWPVATWMLGESFAVQGVVAPTGGALLASGVGCWTVL